MVDSGSGKPLLTELVSYDLARPPSVFAAHVFHTASAFVHSLNILCVPGTALGAFYTAVDRTKFLALTCPSHKSDSEDIAFRSALGTRDQCISHRSEDKRIPWRSSVKNAPGNLEGGTWGVT